MVVIRTVPMTNFSRQITEISPKNLWAKKDRWWRIPVTLECGHPDLATLADTKRGVMGHCIFCATNTQPKSNQIWKNYL